MTLDVQQIAFIKTHGITHCPPSPECLGFGLGDWRLSRQARRARIPAREEAEPVVRRHGNPARRHYWSLARLGDGERGKAKSENGKSQ